MRAGYIKCSLGGLFEWIHLFIYLQFKRKMAIHKIQEEAKKVYKNSTIKNEYLSNASVNLLDLLLRPKDAVKRLAQLVAQLLIDIRTSLLCGNPRRAALKMRHRIALCHGRAVLVARRRAAGPAEEDAGVVSGAGDVERRVGREEVGRADVKLEDFDWPV